MGKVAIALTLILGGCATGGGLDTLAFCDGAQPLRPAPGETAQLSDSLLDQIDQHNEVGVKACGWSP